MRRNRRPLRALTGVLLVVAACGIVITIPLMALIAGILFAVWLPGTSSGRQTLAMTRVRNNFV